MDIEIHQFNRTSADAGYPPGLQAFFSRVVASGVVHRRRRAPALFDGATGQYLYEPYVSGGCPTCGAAAGGNICEECGEPNSCADLVEPRANGSDAEPAQGQHHPVHAAPARAARRHPGAPPARPGAGPDAGAGRPALPADRLDMAITHPAEWGVSPGRGGRADRDRSSGSGSTWRTDSCTASSRSAAALGEDWRADAPEPDWKIVHFLGYDNTFYHSILAPALYKLAYPDWTPDIDYHVNEFYELDSSKFSTSRGHAVWGKDILGPHSVDSVRFHLARTRPEGAAPTSPPPSTRPPCADTLVGTWQRWLNDLGARLDKHYGGVAPDAGIWTPEHTAFLARLGARLSALTGALGQDGFSLNHAAGALDGIVDGHVSVRRASRAPPPRSTAGGRGTRPRSRWNSPPPGCSRPVPRR